MRACKTKKTGILHRKTNINNVPFVLNTLSLKNVMNRMPIQIRILIIIAVIAVLTGTMTILQHKDESGTLKIAFGAEFLTRPDGYDGLSRHYDLRFKSEPKQMIDGLMYKALANGSVDIINGFYTDGRITAYDLFCLQDDKNFFPPYYAAPLIRKETLKRYPHLEQLLNTLAGKISNETMRKLNFDVDDTGFRVEDVARGFLAKVDLVPLDARPRNGSAGSITVGSKEFTEQEILGEIIAILIECNSDIKVVRKLNLGGTIICFNALKAGDLDIYPEYTGTGLVNILKHDVISDPKKVYDIVSRQFESQYDMLWLKPLGFNNTYTLTMRAEHAKRLRIRSISDLVRYVNLNQSKD